MSAKPNIAIIGAGIIGLSCAWELAKRGAKVTVYEKNWPPRGASWAAAGMLAPAYEAANEDNAHPHLFDLCMESAQMWAEFAGALQNDSGLELGYRSGSTLAVATTDRDVLRLMSLKAVLAARRVPHAMLTADEARAQVPDLGHAVTHILQLPTDGWVDNRACLLALETVCFQMGVTLVKEIAHCVVDPGRSEFVGLISGDRPNAPLRRFDAVIATAGHALQGYTYRSGNGFLGEPEPQDMDIATFARDLRHIFAKPGRLVTFAPDGAVPNQVIRSGDNYLVPRGNTVVAHLSGVQPSDISDDARFDADGITPMMTAFYPPLATAKVVDHWSAIRPMTRDHAPMFGKTDVHGLSMAGGHSRNGILLAPVTAKIMTDMILDDHVSDLAAAFSPSRFASATA